MNEGNDVARRGYGLHVEPEQLTAGLHAKRAAVRMARDMYNIRMQHFQQKHLRRIYSQRLLIS